MSLVDTTTGEVVSLLDEREARDLTDRIKGHAETLWALLLEAHDRQAWKALGYSSWREYATTEFDMSQSTAYEILTQGRVIREIETASGISGVPEISGREARDLKPRLADVAQKIRERIPEESLGDRPTDLDERRRIVCEVVAEERAAAQKKREDREAIRALEDEYRPEGFDAAADQEQILARVAVQEAIAALAEADDVQQMADEWPDHARHHLALIPAAIERLTTLARLVEVSREAV